MVLPTLRRFAVLWFVLLFAFIFAYGVSSAEEPAAAIGAQAVSVQIIFDAYGSMNDEWEGRNKLDLAREALGRALEELEGSSARLSLRCFGFDRQMEEAGDSCFNSTLLIDFNHGESRAIIEAVRDLEAHGKTPIARSLRLAGKDLMPYRRSRPMVLLITDGRETCGGDPVQVIRRLRAGGLDVRVHVVGLDLTEESRQELQSIARAGQGLFHDANNLSDLSRSLEAFTGQVRTQAAARHQKSLKGRRAIQGGGLPEHAEEIAGGFYRLERDLPTGRRAFFFVRTRKAKTAAIQALPAPASEKAGNRYLTVDLYDPEGRRILGRSVRFRSGAPSAEAVRYVDIRGEGFTFSIGDDYNTVEKGALIDVAVLEAGDGKPAFEAHAEPSANALLLEYEKAIKAHIGLEDRSDSYRLRAAPKNKRSVKIILSFEDPDFEYEVQVFDPSNGSRMKSFPGNRGQSVSVVPVLESTPGLWIRIIDANPPRKGRFSAYSLTLNHN